MIAYLILTATLTAPVTFALGFRMKPFVPPAPGCPCQDRAAIDAAERESFERLLADYDLPTGHDDIRDAA